MRSCIRRCPTDPFVSSLHRCIIVAQRCKLFNQTRAFQFILRYSMWIVTGRNHCPPHLGKIAVQFVLQSQDRFVIVSLTNELTPQPLYLNSKQCPVIFVACCVWRFSFRETTESVALSTKYYHSHPLFFVLAAAGDPL
jgi:hypothetical protein